MLVNLAVTKVSLVFGGPGITSWKYVCCCCVGMSCACTSTLRIPTVYLSSTSHMTAHKATAKSNTNLVPGPPVSMAHLKIGLLLHHPTRSFSKCQFQELLRVQTLQHDCPFARAVAWGGTWGGLAAFPPVIPAWSPLGSCFQSLFSDGLLFF